MFLLHLVVFHHNFINHFLRRHITQDSLLCCIFRWEPFSPDRVYRIASLAPGWDPSAAAGRGVGASGRSRRGWGDASRSEAVWSSGTAPHSPPGCKALDSNPALDGPCRSWRCGSQLCSSPAVEDSAHKVKGRTVKLMVQINLNLANAVLHSDSPATDGGLQLLHLLTARGLGVYTWGTCTDRGVQGTQTS